MNEHKLELCFTEEQLQGLFNILKGLPEAQELIDKYGDGNPEWVLELISRYEKEKQ